MPSSLPHPPHSSPSKPLSLLPRTPKHYFFFSSTNANASKLSPFPRTNPKPHLSLLPAAAAAQSAFKIDVEATLIAIDDFFTRYPFFVSSVVFVWLVVIPLTQEYLKKYKPISAINAFQKLRDVPECQLLDIRARRSVAFMPSPNLKILNKSAVWVEYPEGEDDEQFVAEVMKEFGDPSNTILCVLDNFDGNSLKVAELLHNNGFKEAYAIKGGLRGKDGWQAIQETLLPPSVHVYPRKKKKKRSAKSKVNIQEKDEQHSSNGRPQSSSRIQQDESLTINNGYFKTMDATQDAELIPERPLSPFPNYPDLKPPSSPTPSKPQT